MSSSIKPMSIQPMTYQPLDKNGNKITYPKHYEGAKNTLTTDTPSPYAVYDKKTRAEVSYPKSSSLIAFNATSDGYTKIPGEDVSVGFIYYINIGQETTRIKNENNRIKKAKEYLKNNPDLSPENKRGLNNYNLQQDDIKYSQALNRYKNVAVSNRNYTRVVITKKGEKPLYIEYKYIDEGLRYLSFIIPIIPIHITVYKGQYDSLYSYLGNRSYYNISTFYIKNGEEPKKHQPMIDTFNRMTKQLSLRPSQKSASIHPGGSIKKGGKIRKTRKAKKQRKQ
jgi:hypothetical protein